ncbi:CHAD domain-containing protein [Lysobacter korlensis]|uniref:CHAD domain-containing protein n=1 Tax=Lysobacter korlensis TaxID=553636 RepID=A0ABV6RZ54_9GAMM
MDPESGADTRTFRVADDVDLPLLDSVKGIAGTDGVASAQFSTKYFDTADLALTSAGITLLHRSGVPDAGWRLELPAPDGGATVLRRPGIGTNTVPKPLRDALHLHTRGATLVPIGRTRTDRRTISLLDKAGTAVARLRDDRVSGSAAAPVDTGPLLAWRQWTVELADGKRRVLDDLGVLLEASNATRAAPEPELARILGDRAPSSPGTDEPKRIRGRSSAADVVGAHLRQQLAELEHWDVLTRWDAPDSIHKLRVATRRLRSALATFRPLLDREQTDPIRDELRWIAGLLGEARDLEVSHEYLSKTIADHPVELMIGPVSQHVDRELSGEHRDARGRAVEAMGTERYFTMVDRLRVLVADPPWTPGAEKRAAKLLRGRVTADFKRLRKRVAAAEVETDPEKRVVLLHDVRKAAKRTRYAAEALVPVHGEDAERFAAAAERVQEVLGDHHDAVTLLPRIRQLGVQAHLDGANAFSYGRLHALEQTRIAELEAEYRDAWKAASRKKLRRWLR